MAGDRVRVKSDWKELRGELRRPESSYKVRLESKLQLNTTPHMRTSLF